MIEGSGWTRGKTDFFLLGCGVDLGNVCKEVENTAGVTPLVVVPGDELDEVLVEGDTGLGVEDGGGVVAVQVGGDDLVLGVSENTWGVLLVWYVMGVWVTDP